MQMLYKTIVQELLEQQTELYESLRSTRQLAPALENLALVLRASHDIWRQQLLSLNPQSEMSQISSEALELATEELVNLLRSESAQLEAEPLSLDQAMAFIKKHSSKR